MDVRDDGWIDGRERPGTRPYRGRWTSFRVNCSGSLACASRSRFRNRGRKARERLSTPSLIIVPFSDRSFPYKTSLYARNRSP